MEAVVKLKKASWEFHIPVSLVVQGIMIAGFVFFLYMGGRIQRPEVEILPGAVLEIRTDPKIQELPVVRIPDNVNKLSVDRLEETLKTVEKYRVNETAVSTVYTHIGFVKEVFVSLPSAEVIPDKATPEPGDDVTVDNPPDDSMTKPSVPEEFILTVYGNGGYPEKLELTLDDFDFSVDSLVKPRRLGKEFADWYADAACTIPFSKVPEGAKNVAVYAGWKDFDGYICNDKGYITGYTDFDAVTEASTIVFPISEDCLGVESGALSGLEDYIVDVYIHSNITYLAPGLFDGFHMLFWIEVSPDNPVYKSEQGVLYLKDGTLVVDPEGRYN